MVEVIHNPWEDWAIEVPERLIKQVAAEEIDLSDDDGVAVIEILRRLYAIVKEHRLDLPIPSVAWDPTATVKLAWYNPFMAAELEFTYTRKKGLRARQHVIEEQKDDFEPSDERILELLKFIESGPAKENPENPAAEAG